MRAKVKKDCRVDAYIGAAPEYAKPILNHLRKLVHTACPDVEETMKWSRPHFLHNGLLCGMSAFKQHCSFGFWMGDAIRASMGQTDGGRDGMGHFGKIAALADLPNDAQLLGFIRKAVELNDSGAKRPVAPRPEGPRELVVPECVTAALKKNKKALAAFEAFSYSHRKEYVEWITEAKREETRQKRIETMLAWLADGKTRNWKYANC